MPLPLTPLRLQLKPSLTQSRPYTCPKPLQRRKCRNPNPQPSPQPLTPHRAQQVPLYWASRQGSRHLRVRLRESGAEWSGTFVPDVAGDTTLRLRNTHSETKYLLQVSV